MKIHMILKGFRFGLLLQLAVGPICLFIFNVAIRSGLINAMFGILGVVIIDALYITLSIIGVTSLVKKNERLLRVLGTVILVIFGCMTIYNALLIDNNTTDLQISSRYLDTFLKVIVLTGGNPLTIVFWSGVFSSKIVEEDFSRIDEILFGIGAVLSTFIFLTIVAIIGQFTSTFIDDSTSMILNIIVGLLLIYFGLRLSIKKSKSV